MNAEIIGVIAALLLAGGAYLRSRGPGGFYDAGIYGMTAIAHRRYALTALGFAAAFGALARWFPGGGATLLLWAAFVLFAVFYVTSYLRGAHDDDE